MYIFQNAESFSASLSPDEYDPAQNEENEAYFVGPAKAVVEQPTPGASSFILGGAIEFKVARRADNSIELNGSVTISQDERTA